MTTTRPKLLNTQMLCCPRALHTADYSMRSAEALSPYGGDAHDALDSQSPHSDSANEHLRLVRSAWVQPRPTPPADRQARAELGLAWGFLSCRASMPRLS